MDFDKEIYEGEVIFQAARDYAELATIVVTDRGSCWSCIFSHCRYDSELTQREFTNYVLELTAQRETKC